jgi:small multidrug resistance pump
MHYLYLLIAIVSEVAATTALKSAEGFTRVLPSTVVVVGYSVAYAIWAGMGIVLIAILGAVVHGQRLDLPAVVGMLLIVTGVVVINAFSATQVH